MDSFTVKTLKERLDFEMEIYELNLLGTSRENILDKVREIQIKRMLYESLKENAERLTEEDIKKIVALDNIIDYFYLKVKNKINFKNEIKDMDIKELI